MWEKMGSHYTILLLVVIAGTTLISYSQGFRLPETQIPSEYDIKLNFPDAIFEGTNSIFTGTVNVFFQSTVSTKIVQIHSPGPVKKVQIGDISSSKVIAVLEKSYNSTSEILSISLGDNLVVNSTYQLAIEYEANLDVLDRRGVFRSTYTDDLGLRYFITTQFQPTHARKAFPCFDEPRYKAMFTLSLTFPGVGFNALSNAPIKNTDISDSTVTVQFETTPKMSTYLVAFIISNFTCTWGSSISPSVYPLVCSRSKTQMDRFLANSNTPNIMNKFHSVTNITYGEHGFNKLHQIAVPDFYPGAMENWGLPIYRESLLLWSTEESSNYDRQKVLSTISHEFAHFWFGNLVTNDWWDNLFLNEGFASYFQYFILSNIDSFESSENWQMAKQFIVEEIHTALVADGHFSAKALTSSVESPQEVSRHFNVISYRKGSSILRMLENIINSKNFLNGVRRYLAERKFQTALPHHLWDSMQSEVDNNILPEKTTVTEVMENWISKPGYPLVTVSAVDNDIHIKQKRFLYDLGGNDSTQWYVPISYTLSSEESQFVNLGPRTWLTPNKDTVIPNILQNHQWIIINNQESAYYRVNYDELLWKRVRFQLFYNIENINVLNRAQIVDDSFNLARAGELNYSQAFSTIIYLFIETEYFPWHAATKGFDYLTTVFGENSEIGNKLNEFQHYLMQNVYKVATFSSLNALNQIHTLRLNLILNRLCRIGENNCIFYSKKLYQDFRSGISVDKNLKSVVYCNGLRYSSDIHNDWKHLWNHLQETYLATEKREIIAALGCTTDSSYLNFYLEQAMNSSSVLRLQDFSSIWASVYKSSSYGLEVALEFFLKNHEKISSYYADAAEILSNIASRIYTQDQLTQLKTFFTSTKLADSLQELSSKAIADATANLEWSERRKSEIHQFFTENPIPETTYPTTPDFPTTTPSPTTALTTSITTAVTTATTTAAATTAATSIPTINTAAPSTPTINTTSPSTSITEPTTTTTPTTLITPSTISTPSTASTTEGLTTKSTTPPNEKSVPDEGIRREMPVVIIMLMLSLVYIYFEHFFLVE